MKQLLLLALLYTSAYNLSSQVSEHNINMTPIEDMTGVPPKVNRGLSVSPALGTYFNLSPANQNSTWFSGGLELDFHRNDMLYTLQYYRFIEFNFFDNSAERTQIGFQIGKQSDYKLLRFVYQAGLAYYGGANVGFEYRDTYKSVSTIGLTTKVGLRFMPLSFLSIGLDLETNINSKESIYMPMFKIGIGRIRSKRNKKISKVK